MVTTHGFIWGPLNVERLALFDRSNGIYRILRLNTKYEDLEVYVSPTGRRMRVFRAGTELAL